MSWPAYLGIAIGAFIILVVFGCAFIAAMEADEFFESHPEMRR